LHASRRSFNQLTSFSVLSFDRFEFPKVLLYGPFSENF
jgi:hypothetical protein